MRRGRAGAALVLTGPRSRAASAAAALRTCGAGLRRFARTSGPGLLAVAVALAACTSSSAPPQPQTARVERTTVFTAVSSSGALAASSEQNLGFLKGGRLTAVNVKVGDRVTAGQVLANLDDGPARRALEQQQAQLDAQRAVLDRLVNSTTVQGAQNSVEQAQAILDATEDQVEATQDADESALDRAEKQLDFDEDARDDAKDQLDADEEACEAVDGHRARRRPGRSPSRSRRRDAESDRGARAGDPTAARRTTPTPRAGARTTRADPMSSAPGGPVVRAAPGGPTATTTGTGTARRRRDRSPRSPRRSTRSGPAPAAVSRPTSRRWPRRTGRSRPAAPPATPHGSSATSTPPRVRCRSRTPARAS